MSTKMSHVTANTNKANSAQKLHNFHLTKDQDEISFSAGTVKIKMSRSFLFYFLSRDHQGK